MKALPKFRTHRLEYVETFMRDMLTSHVSPQSHLRRVIAYDDGHYRALFDPAFFTLAEGAAEPTRSQWNSLKKKIKRHDPHVFIFKEHGSVTGVEGIEGPVYFLDFGYFQT
jgi:hypothetical protein